MNVQLNVALNSVYSTEEEKEEELSLRLRSVVRKFIAMPFLVTCEPKWVICTIKMV